VTATVAKAPAAAAAAADDGCEVGMGISAQSPPESSPKLAQPAASLIHRNQQLLMRNQQTTNNSVNP